MARHWYLLGLCLFVAVLYVGCGSSGGGGGEEAGEQRSAVQGNVTDLISSEGARMRSLEGTEVSLRGTGLATETDSSGFFRLEGNFSGNSVVDFVVPNQGAAEVLVNVPNGDTVVLQDLTLDMSNNQALPLNVLVIDDGRNPPQDPDLLDDTNDDTGGQVEGFPVLPGTVVVGPDGTGTVVTGGAGGVGGVGTGVTPGVGTGVTTGVGSGVGVGGVPNFNPAGTPVSGSGGGTVPPVVIGDPVLPGGGDFNVVDGGAADPAIPGGGSIDFPILPTAPPQVDVLNEDPSDAFDEVEVEGEFDDNQVGINVGPGSSFENIVGDNNGGTGAAQGSGLGGASSVSGGSFGSGFQ